MRNSVFAVLIVIMVATGFLGVGMCIGGNEAIRNAELSAPSDYTGNVVLHFTNGTLDGIGVLAENGTVFWK